MMYRSIDSCSWWWHFWQTLRCLWISFTYTGLSCSEQTCAWCCCLESYYPFSPKHINPDSWAYPDIPFHCVLGVRVNALSLSVAVSCIPWRRACASRGNSCWWWISSRKTLTWRGIPMISSGYHARSMSFSKMSDEIIGRPGDLKSQRLQISRNETCEESAHFLLKTDEQGMDAFDAVW